MQASLLASAALTAEVDTLKQNLVRSENELGHAKRQVEEKEVSNTLRKYIEKMWLQKMTGSTCYYRGHDRGGNP